MSKNSNLLGNNINTDNVEIVYNKDEEIDIIQQFQEEQNKKLSENINSLNEDEHSENLFIRRNSSTPSLQTKDSNSNVAKIKKSLTMPPLENDKEEDDTPKKTLPLNKSVLDIKEKKKNKVISFDNNNILNNHKSILSGNINDRGKGHLRMTTARKSKKNYLDRGSYLDVYLKKNHPDNIRKTMSKETDIFESNIEEIKEGIKENE